MSTAPKKRKNGRRKGKVGENEVAKLFAAWWQAVEPGCEFRSTPSSGGWATPQLRGHFKVAGDLTTTAKRWPFTVEVKRREAWCISRVYAGMPSPVWAWWRQAVAAAEEEGRTPILMMRKNGDPEWFVMLPESVFKSFVPRFDSGLMRPPLASVKVQPLLTSWEVLRRLPVRRIIKACREFASAQADRKGATQFLQEVDQLERKPDRLISSDPRAPVQQRDPAWRKIKLDAEKALRRNKAQERRERAKDPVKQLDHLRRKAGGRLPADQVSKQTQGYFDLITGKPSPLGLKRSRRR